MTLDGFLTFLALMIAAYGVMPSATRLRLQLQPFLVSLISIICFVLVIYYEMIGQDGFYCPAKLGVACTFLVLNDKKFPTAGEVAFAILIIWGLVTWFVLTRRTISARALPNLRRLVDQLLYERRLAELIQVVEPHLQLLAAAAGRKLRGARLYDRLRRWRRSETFIEFRARAALSEGHHSHAVWQRALDAVKFGSGTVGRFLPDGNLKQNSAKEILRVLLLNHELIEFITLYRGAFGVKLLNMPVDEVYEFSNNYLVALISTQNSTLYTEIKNNQNLSSTLQYVFPKENRLLHFLFGDARQAERLGVWKPLGEYVIVRLNPDRYPDYTNSLNLSSDSFDAECWEDPTFVVVRFFDLMVSAAEYQDVNWHMWLYYFPHILERLLKIYSDDGRGVEVNDECPTRTAYIIHEMFRAMGDWIRAVRDLPEGSSQLMLDNERVDHENGNIPKSAILALGMCLRDLLLAGNVGDRFKGTVVDLVIRTIGNLPQNGPRSGFRRVMIASIVQGGSHWSATDRAYGKELLAGYYALDHVLRERLDDVTSAFQNSYGED